jgi:hypothetical protein
MSAYGTLIAVKGYKWSRMWRHQQGRGVADTMLETPCPSANGFGEAIGFSADGSGYFTVPEGTTPRLSSFDLQA